VTLTARFRATLARRRAAKEPAKIGSRPLLALPAPPATPPEWPVCPRCGGRHEPRPLPRQGGRGLAAAYSRNLLPDPNRPQPLNRGEVDDTSLQRDRFRPWSGL
jgi:hypothetical protein